MKNEKKIIEKIARQVESETELGGLACGIYLAFATDIAIRYVRFLCDGNIKNKASRKLKAYERKGNKLIKAMQNKKG